MKAFITGATGFIGTRLVRRMACTGYELRCLARSTSDVSNIAAVGAAVVRGDVVDRDAVVRGMEGCDLVVNLAAAYEFWLPSRSVYHDVNVIGTRNVMEGALHAGVRKVVHVSSIVIFGKPSEDPITENSAVGGIRFSEYARTKYEGDRIAWALWEQKGLPLVVLYPGAVLGPADPKSSGRYLERIIERRLPATIFDDTIFPFVHVDDVVEAVVRAVEKPDNAGEKYLIVGENLTFAEINAMISEIARVALPRFRLPGGVAILLAAGLTWWADRVKRPPLWGMAVDQMRTMREGARVDGSKAERELGLHYIPIRTALEQAVAHRRRCEPVSAESAVH